MEPDSVPSSVADWVSSVIVCSSLMLPVPVSVTESVSVTASDVDGLSVSVAVIDEVSSVPVNCSVTDRLSVPVIV